MKNNPLSFSNVQFDDVNLFLEPFVVHAEKDGRELTSDELETLNSDRELVELLLSKSVQ